MLDQTKKNLPESASEILGDLTALAQQLGDSRAVVQISAGAALNGLMRVETVADAKRFLEDYTSKMLLAHELPAVSLAYWYSMRHQVTELIGFDKQLGHVPGLEPLAAASRTIGRHQLRRLRPLRDDRLVQRYLNAVDTGEAHGWHTLVYGLVLALYSLPLRQGLTHFARQTLSGFVDAAGDRLGLHEAERKQLLSAQAGFLSRGVEAVLAQHAPTVPRIA